MRLASMGWIICAGSVGVLGCEQVSQSSAMEALVQSLDLDPSIELDINCLPSPPGTRTVLFAGIFVNQPPIRPDSAEFPEDFCPSNARFYELAEGGGKSSVLGEFVWSEQCCALPMAEIVAEGSFSSVNADRVDWDAHVQADTVPPPIPFATFSGEFTFKGGTGPFAGTTGSAAVAAAQLGDAAPGQPAGSTAAAVCGWIEGGERR